MDVTAVRLASDFFVPPAIGSAPTKIDTSLRAREADIGAKHFRAILLA